MEINFSVVDGERCVSLSRSDVEDLHDFTDFLLDATKIAGFFWAKRLVVETEDREYVSDWKI